MNDHLRILERAANGSLPEEIDEGSSVSIDIVRELFEAGYLWAIDASTISGDAFLNPRITIQGRQYLNDLQQQVDAADRELLSRVDRLRSILITVATGGPRIDEVNAEYQSDFEYVDRELRSDKYRTPSHFEACGTGMGDGLLETCRITGRGAGLSPP
jgi:hypothetical protein